MTDAVTYSKHDNIGLIKVNNPPINALSHQVRCGLQESAERGIADPDVDAMVILCEGRTFIAGADIREFGKPMQDPRLWDVAQLIEDSPKPMIAAIHGTALGGGLELALSCHFRVAVVNAKMGLPEVKLGLMPGAGGTQRLPRLIGVRSALNVIVNGDPLPAKEALTVGLIDEILDGDLEVAAIAFARRVVEEKRPLRNVSEMTARIDNPDIFEEFTESARLKRRGFIAPLKCIQAVRGAVELPFSEGFKQERALFAELSSSSQAQAQQHVFFAEREAAKIPGLPAETRNVKSAGVVGAGSTGRAIAICFADAGIPVVLLDTSQEKLNRGVRGIREYYSDLTGKGLLTPSEIDERVAGIKPTHSFNDLEDADLVIESAFDEISKKQEIFALLDRVCKPGAILASNTVLSIDRLAAATNRPNEVIGMHFFSRANVSKALEIARGATTKSDVCATAMKVAKLIGMVPVLLGASDGLVGERMLSMFTREIRSIVEEGAGRLQVEGVLYEFGFPMETLKLAAFEPGADGGTAFCSPAVEDPLATCDGKTSTARREISDQEILERCLYLLINEAAKILDERIAARPLDIDVVWIHAYGFPVYRGGPMFYADLVGVQTVHDAVLKYRHLFGSERWKPAQLLEKLAADGKGFYSR